MTRPGPILVLAGTEEGRQCCTRLHDETPCPVVASLAGVTRAPARYSVPVRAGGFGGWSGLADYLQSASIGLVVDATHPFAVQISRNACKACTHTGVPLAVLSRPPWQPRAGDDWRMVTSLEEALAALPPRATVLAALGRKQLATLNARDDLVERHIRMIVRSVDPVPLSSRPGLEFVASRPPHTTGAEQDYMKRHAITALLCRNSGGATGRAKLDAARTLGLAVYMIDRPRDARYAQGFPYHDSIEALLAWIKTRLRTPRVPGRQNT